MTRKTSSTNDRPSLRTDNRVPSALRKVADRLERSWNKGEQSAAIDLFDLCEVLQSLADEIDGRRASGKRFGPKG